MTIRAWRLVQARWVDAAFSGEGAQKYGGRWNHRGIPMVYTAGSVSLAALELLANLHAPEQLRNFISIPVTFHDSLILQLPVEDLPSDWNAPVTVAGTRDIGSSWAANNLSAVLAVPSAVIPLEANYLLNPLHPDFQKLQIGVPEAFQFDPRLFG
jgi:RES domain-containing protein